MGGHYVVGRLVVALILVGMFGGGTQSAWVYFYFIDILLVTDFRKTALIGQHADVLTLNLS